MRIILLLVAIGLGLNGLDGLRLVSGTSGLEQAELADLEAGYQPQSNFIALGEHYRVTAPLVYSHSSSASETLGADTALNHVYYALISEDNLTRYIEHLQAAGDGTSGLGDIAVLVKSKEFATLGELQAYDAATEYFEPEAAMQGLAINSISELSDSEIRLLQSGFGDVDWSRVLIIERDREPASMAVALIQVVVALTLLGFVGRGFYQRLKDRRRRDSGQAT